MKLVVGLGNPGPAYAASRHNAGFRVVEAFASRHAIALDERRFDGRFGRGVLPAAAGSERLDVGLLEPETWMNRSGDAVAAALAELPVADPARDLLLAFDDVDLPFGRLRLRGRGGAGGHRGLEHVIARLGTDAFARLRVGVGRPPPGQDTVDYVLAPFTDDEQRQLPALLGRAVDALETALRLGVAAAMNAFNRDPGAPEAAPTG